MLSTLRSCASPLRGTTSVLAGFRSPARASSVYRWSTEREPHILPRAEDIIKVGEIESALERTKARAKDAHCVRDIVTKAKERALLKHVRVDECRNEYVQGLDLEDAATLLNVDTNDKVLMDEILNAARFVKEAIYGKRIVLFAPLYLANHCVNQCTYCGFRGPNHDMARKTLSLEEVKEEAHAIQRLGHKRVLVLCGESPRYTFDDFLQALALLRDTKTPPHGEFRRINVEIPPLSVSDMRRLKELKCVGTYTLFQETYHPKAYRKFHPGGPKADYEYRLQTMDRAQIAGVDDVGVGALFGLHDFRFEVLGLLQHAQHLDRTYGSGPHTISVPRMRPAKGAETSFNPPYPVDDPTFRKIVAVIRCAVPYTGMILSTREAPQMRRDLVSLGVSQISAGSRTDVGSYNAHEDGAEHQEGEEGQFALSDERPIPAILHDLLSRGTVPSWCTACYRKGRTGEAFMRIAKRGDIQNYCQPNALFTLQEYLCDYADERLRRVGEEAIARELAAMKDPARREATRTRLEQIKNGERDVYF